MNEIKKFYNPQKKYLFEADSVRKSKEEINRGKQKIFNEIVINGNNIVFSFNQITDSMIFLDMIWGESENNDKADEQNKIQYEAILELFKMNVFSVNNYEDVRTPSQYIQNAIEKTIGSDNDKFIFSGLPIKDNEEALLNLVLKSLRYSDAQLINDCIDLVERLKKEYGNNKIMNSKLKEKNLAKSKSLKKLSLESNHIRIDLFGSLKTKNTGDNNVLEIDDAWIKEKIFGNVNFYEKLSVEINYIKDLIKKYNDNDDFNIEIKRLRQIYKYINLILLIRREDVANNEIKANSKNLLCFLNKILKEKINENQDETGWRVHYNESLKILEFIKNGIENEAALNARSKWYEEINNFPLLENNLEDIHKYMAIAIIDICYNYAIEDSITGINNINFTFNDFCNKLDDYWDLFYKRKINEIDMENEDNYENCKKEDVDFNDWSYAAKLWNEELKSNLINGESKGKSNYKWKTILSYSLVIKPILTSIIMVIAYYLFNKFLGFIPEINFKPVFDALFNIIFIGIMSSLIMKKLKIQDILDIFKMLFYNISIYWKHRKINKKI